MTLRLSITPPKGVNTEILVVVLGTVIMLFLCPPFAICTAFVGYQVWEERREGTGFQNASVFPTDGPSGGGDKGALAAEKKRQQLKQAQEKRLKDALKKEEAQAREAAKLSGQAQKLKDDMDDDDLREELEKNTKKYESEIAKLESKRKAEVEALQKKIADLMEKEDPTDKSTHEALSAHQKEMDALQKSLENRKKRQNDALKARLEAKKKAAALKKSGKKDLDSAIAAAVKAGESDDQELRAEIERDRKEFEEQVKEIERKRNEEVAALEAKLDALMDDDDGGENDTVKAIKNHEKELERLERAAQDQKKRQAEALKKRLSQRRR